MPKTEKLKGIASKSVIYREREGKPDIKDNLVNKLDSDAATKSQEKDKIECPQSKTIEIHIVETMAEDVTFSDQKLDAKQSPNSADNTSDSSDNDIEIKLDEEDGKELPTKKFKRYAPKYRKEWENKLELKAWLTESIRGNTYFYCRFCKKDFSRCGISEIYKHMASKKHIQQAAAPVKAKRFQFSGLLCPALTPFVVDGRKGVADIDYNGLVDYATFLKSCNIGGILINDHIGEGMSLSTKERIQLTEVWASICDRNQQFLMVQIGGAPFKEILEMALHARNHSVGAVVILPDLYNKPKTHLELIRYIKIIAEYTMNIPILYHHNPKYTEVDIDINALLVDIVGEIEYFVGIIYSTNDLQKVMAAATINSPKFSIIVGTDEVILGTAASGLTSIMANSLNFFPKVVQSIVGTVQKGNLKAAQTSQQFLNNTIDAIVKYGDPVATLKAATSIITSSIAPITREPVQQLWEGTIQKMRKKLKETGII